MRCLHPIAMLLDGKRQFVPCGKCNFCLEARRNDWSFRLRQELKVSVSSQFLTLTYNDEEIPYTPEGIQTLRKRDLQLFLKRLRKSASDSRLRYYAVGEYGTRTARPHYHVLLFNLLPSDSRFLETSWNCGHLYSGTVTPASIHYVAKYHVNAVGEFGDRAPPFSIMSRKPGIGQNYLETHTRWHLDGVRNYTQVNGQIARLPRYYRDKIFKAENDEGKLVYIVDQALMLGDRNEVKEYYDEIQRLEKLHEDPAAYYGERFRAAGDAVKHKSNLQNKF